MVQFTQTLALLLAAGTARGFPISGKGIHPNSSIPMTQNPSSSAFNKTISPIPEAKFRAFKRPLDKCRPTTNPVLQAKSHTASWIDCEEIMNWARENGGTFTLDRTSTADETNWVALRRNRNCAIVAKNEKETRLGNMDLYDLLQEVFYNSGTRAGPIEATGSVVCGKGEGVEVQWWLRDDIE